MSANFSTFHFEFKWLLLQNKKIVKIKLNAQEELQIDVPALFVNILLNPNSKFTVIHKIFFWMYAGNLPGKFRTKFEKKKRHIKKIKKGYSCTRWTFAANAIKILRFGGQCAKIATSVAVSRITDLSASLFDTVIGTIALWWRGQGRTPRKQRLSFSPSIFLSFVFLCQIQCNRVQYCAYLECAL